MSQEKVDRYKEEKRNREKLIKKQKREALLLKVGGLVVALVLVGWVGFSAYTHITGTGSESGTTYTVDTAALDNFMSTMSTEKTE